MAWTSPGRPCRRAPVTQGARVSVSASAWGSTQQAAERDTNHSSLSTSRVPGTALATPPSSSHWTLSPSPARGQDHVLATPKVPGTGPGHGHQGQRPWELPRGGPGRPRVTDPASGRRLGPRGRALQGEGRGDERPRLWQAGQEVASGPAGWTRARH